LAAGVYKCDDSSELASKDSCFSAPGKDDASGLMNFVFQWNGNLLGSEEGETIFDGEDKRQIFFIESKMKEPLIMKALTFTNGNGKPDDGFIGLGGALTFEVDGPFRSSVQLERCNFHNNRGEKGGAIYVYGSLSTVKFSMLGNSFSDNKADFLKEGEDFGDDLQLEGSADLTVGECPDGYTTTKGDKLDAKGDNVANVKGDLVSYECTKA